jgi:hypothetical protein
LSENDFGHYSIGSTTDGLKKAADGSVTIFIQKDKLADTSNWLPAPAGNFNLTMRLYGPETSVLDGSYRLVISGGSAMPAGFRDRFEKLLTEADLPLRISAIRLAQDPLNSTAKGALISAIAEI